MFSTIKLVQKDRILQEMMHAKDIIPLASDRLIKTVIDLITKPKQGVDFHKSKV